MKIKKNYISKIGYDKLVLELNELQIVERPKVVSLVSWAASLGDRSENADYQYGKRRLREIDRRISFLNSRINTAEIVDYIQNKGSNIVRFGATVTIEDEEGNEAIYVIVGIDEIDLTSGKISYISPIGKNLMGKTIGDEVSISTPAGKKNIMIVAVDYHLY